MVEPKEVAQHSGESLSTADQQGLHAHTYQGPEERMDEICGHGNDEWKSFKFVFPKEANLRVKAVSSGPGMLQHMAWH